MGKSKQPGKRIGAPLSRTHGGTTEPDQEEGQLDRLQLFEQNKPAAALALSKSGADREDVVLFIVDARDPIGKVLTASVGEEAIQKYERKGEVPTAFAAMTIAEASEFLEDINPATAAKLQEPLPPKYTRIVVAMSGGTTFVASVLPQVPSSTVGQA